MKARFLNVDLIIQSAEPLHLIAQHIGPPGYVLHSGPTDDGYLLSFEIEGDV